MTLGAAVAPSCLATTNLIQMCARLPPILLSKAALANFKYAAFLEKSNKFFQWQSKKEM